MNSKSAVLVDDSISKAQLGTVNVPPARAIEMAGKLYSDGNFAQAERVCRQIIEHRPGFADAHNILGVVLNAQGHSKEAVASIKRAIKLVPNAASYHSNLGEILRQREQIALAALALKDAIRLEPGNAQAHNNLGIIHYDREEYADAVESYHRAISINPSMAEAHNNLGNALRKSGDPDGAMAAYQDALTYRENYAEAYNNLGTLLKEDARFEEAEHALRKAIAQSPKYIEAHNNLALLHFSRDQELDALRILGDALKINERNPTTLLLTARIQLKRGTYEAAEQATRMVLQDDPKNSEALAVLGQILHETDRYEEAIAVLELALKQEPNNGEARNFYGVALKSVGRLDEARVQILASIAANDSLYGAYANLNDLVDFSKEDELFEKMKTILENAPNLEADMLLPLHFAYAKALDDRGEHAQALHHYITGGRMKRAQLNYSEVETVEFFNSIKQAFPAEIFIQRPFAGNPDDRPVFIVGMPRSGSTLVEQILASHPDVSGAGEVKYLSMALGQLRDRFPSLPKYPMMVENITGPQFNIIADNYIGRINAGSDGARRITDKLLTNYYFVGLIAILFPNAKIINTRRDPIDTCLSAFTKLFKDDMPHSYQLGELGRYYSEYAKLMAHWEKVLPAGVMTTVDYEKVVADTETEARRLIEFLGLDWAPACLEFHKSARPVKTASVAQVRRPIYNSSVKRAKKYGEGLRELIEAVGTPAATPRKGSS